MSQYGTSFFTPDIPIPDPPGANFFIKLPIYLIGFFFLCYILYNIYLEFVDWEKANNPGRFSVEEGGIPEGAPILRPHVNTDESQKCMDCHFPPLSKAAKELLNPEPEISIEDLPPGIDPAILDAEKFDNLLKELRGEASSLSSYAIDVGSFRGDQLCLNCHSPEEFDLAHSGHRIQPLQNCTFCHNLHNPSNRPMLSNSSEELCLQCHEYP